MSAKVTFNGLAAFIKKLEEATAVGLNAAAEVVQKEAISKAPSRTGNLRRNIKVKPAEDGKAHVYIDKDAFYGRFVEMGTSKKTAQPFLRPALDENENKLVKAFQDAARKELDKGD